jgi:predicted ribosome quality control (RQC) complex YloA/Tae2 family protein
MPKEEMDTFDVRALADELAFLEGGNFDKAFQPSDEEVVLRFYVPSHDDPGIGGDSTSKDLAILAGEWTCVTKHPRENPLDPPEFSMRLRRTLGGGRVLDVRQLPFDRVLEIDVGKRDDEVFTIVIELFHDGNVVLVEQDEASGEGWGRIVACMRHQEWSHRTIRPGQRYLPPPDRLDPFAMDLASFRERFAASDTDAVRTLAVEFNLGGTYAEEVCQRTDVDKHTEVDDLFGHEVEALYEALQDVLAPFEAPDHDPVVARDEEGEAVDVAPRPLRKHEGRDLDRYDTFNAALDAYFSRPYTEEQRRAQREAWEEEKARVERKLEQQERALERFDEQEEESQRKGDLVYARYDTVERILETILEASEEHGWDEVQERVAEADGDEHPDADKVADINPHAGQVTLQLDDLEGDGTTKVTLDLSMNVQENATAIYEQGKQAREKRAGAEEALERTREEIRRLEERGASLMEELQEEESGREPTHRFWFEDFRWFVSSDGHLVIGGRDASTNDEVVKKHLEGKDRYAHADVHGAPSVVLKADDGEPPPEPTLEEACLWAVSMSSAWEAGQAGGDAYWVTPPQVSQTPESGEYLPKGAFIVRGSRNHVSGPLEIAVGEVEVQGHRKIMAAPPSAVTERSDAYVVLEPGRTGRNDLANRLSEIWEVPVEEVQRVLPPGDVRIETIHGLPEGEVRGEADD